MHLHILGICGTFMGGLAQLAAAAGHRVTGADSGVYPPMSEQLRQAGIALTEGWDPVQLEPAPDLVVIGNALSRGNPAVEAVLDRDLAYTSGPAWLAEHVLRGRHVLAVAGTHGKTTTASMLTAILDHAGYDPGFLIGGVPRDFGVSARLGSGRYFVIEADEYDTAFFDKRSKFIHYRPRTLVLNNLEFDHADIFDDLAAIKRQFHHLVRIVPGAGKILSNAVASHLDSVLAMGCWTPVERFAVGQGADAALWRARSDETGRRFEVESGTLHGSVAWGLLGLHNVANGLAALAAAADVGVALTTATAALDRFGGVRRRLEERARVAGTVVYDDFAHHPTAIASTLQGLRAQMGSGRILAVLDLASNSMRQGVHRDALPAALTPADRVFVRAAAGSSWDVSASLGAGDTQPIAVFDAVDELADALVAEARSGDAIVLMSNGGFGGMPERLPVLLADAKGGSGHG